MERKRVAIIRVSEMQEPTVHANLDMKPPPVFAVGDYDGTGNDRSGVNAEMPNPHHPHDDDDTQLIRKLGFADFPAIDMPPPPNPRPTILSLVLERGRESSRRLGAPSLTSSRKKELERLQTELMPKQKDGKMSFPDAPAAVSQSEFVGHILPSKQWKDATAEAETKSGTPMRTDFI